MAHYRESFSLDLPVTSVTNTCQRASQEIGWSAKESTKGFVLKEPFKLKWSQLFVIRYPVTVRVSMVAESQNRTLVDMQGSNLGLGPIQSNHVKKQVAALRGAIEHLALESQTQREQRKP